MQITQAPTDVAPSGHPGCSAVLPLSPSAPTAAPPSPGTKLPALLLGAEQRQEECWGCGTGSTLQAGMNCSKHIVIPSKRQEPAHLCKYLLLLVKTLDRVTFLPLFISFICLETQTAKIISRLTSSSDFSGAATCSAAILLCCLKRQSWRKAGRYSCATYNPPRSSHGCREMNEACVDTYDLSHVKQ